MRRLFPAPQTCHIPDAPCACPAPPETTRPRSGRRYRGRRTPQLSAKAERAETREHAVTTPSRRWSKIAAVAAAFAALALSMPAARAAGEPAPGSIKIVYDPPADATLPRPYQLVRERNSLEMLREIFSPFRLPEDLYIKIDRKSTRL